MTASIIRGDARSLPLADNSVDLVVTSPPYFGLRSYQDGGEHYAAQIGAEPTPAEFVEALLEVTRECVRVLRPSGSMWVNLGDKYQNQGGRNGHTSLTGVGRFAGSQSVRRFQTDVPQKSLIGIPWRYALRCIDDLGLILRAEVIWSKPNGLPESVTDRVRRSHEQWFHFVLEPRYFSAVDEVREAYNPASVVHAAKYGQMYPTEYGAGNHGVGSSTLRQSDLNPLGKLPGSVWTIPTQPLQVPASLGVDHFAAFPMEWPRRIIRGWSPSGICVECGEGRRPLIDRELTADRGGRKANVRVEGVMYDTTTTLGREQVVTIVGEGCACTTADRVWISPSGVDHAIVRGNCATCGKPHPLPPTRPAVVLDPFGGTGTTALVASALGRHGISNDYSADYSRLARWRTTDPGQRASAMQVEKPRTELPGQADLFGGEAA